MKHCMFWLSAYFIVWKKEYVRIQDLWRLFVTPVILGGLLGYQPIIMKNVEKKVVPLFHFDHLPNAIAKIFAFYTRFRTCNNMKTLVWGFGCNIAACLKKSPENENFCFKSVQKLDLLKIESDFFLFKIFGIFETWYE